MSPRFGLAIRMRTDALIDEYFPFLERCGQHPWKRELEDAIDLLQQAVSRKEPETERTRLAESHYKKLVKKFVIHRFAKLSEELLRGATKSAAALFHLGDQMEKAFCPREIFAHVRTSELIPNHHRRWTDVVLADRWLSPADVPPSKGWPDNIKTQLKRASIWSQEVQSQVAECETAVIGEQANVTELVKQLHDLLMAALAPAAVSSMPSGQEDEQVTSPSLGVTLIRRRIEKHKKLEYELFRSDDEEKKTRPKPQTGGLLWLLFIAENETRTCRLECKNVEEYWDTQARKSTSKKKKDRHRMALARLNASLKKLSLKATKKTTTDEGARQYLIISKTDSSN